MSLILRDRLARYMRNHHGWIAKGEILKLVAEKTSYTAETAGRRLRDLEGEGILEVRYVKNHAHYRLKEKDLTLFTN